MCDQDDRWYPEKLEVLESSMEPGTKLVYSDMRIVDRTGRVRSDTYWTYRRNNHTNFGSLLLANTVTGAASLFARDVLDYALPFPPHYGAGYHDHWVALVAMALGDVGYVDRPLYDYVQHGEAVLGHARATACCEACLAAPSRPATGRADAAGSPSWPPRGLRAGRVGFTSPLLRHGHCDKGGGDALWGGHDRGEAPDPAALHPPRALDRVARPAFAAALDGKDGDPRARAGPARRVRVALLRRAEKTPAPPPPVGGRARSRPAA